MVELKQLHKQLEAKDEKKAKAEQVAYDVGMTKAAKSLIAQLRDIARAFYLEVWGQALNSFGVSTESELRASDQVYYPSALRLAPNLPQPSVDHSSTITSSSAYPASTSFATLAKGNEKE